MTAIVFDIGNVLVRWDVRALYRKLFDDEAEMEWFLAEVWTDEHNLRCDRGEPFATVTAEVIAQHPDLAEHVSAAHDRWIETIPGPVDGSFQLVEELSDRGVPLYGLTNMSHESFPQLRELYPQLGLLRHVVVSGELGVTKPDARIFEVLCERAGITAEESIFVDDSPTNTAAAAALGFDAVTFADVPSLRVELRERGIPVRS